MAHASFTSRIKCKDRDNFETSTKFYEDVFGIYQTKTGHARGHTSRHMTDGNIDLALMVYDSEEEKEAKLAGPGPRIHHIGIEVEDRPSMIKKIEDNGGIIFSDREEGALKYPRAGRNARRDRRPRPLPRRKRARPRASCTSHEGQRSGEGDEVLRERLRLQAARDRPNHQHISRHMTDGHTDLALMIYDSEDAAEAQLAGSGPCIHHWGLEVDDREAFAEKITKHGGTILSKPEANALKFRAPDGNLAEIVNRGGFDEYKRAAAQKS